MKRIFLAALAATTLFASCSKGENGPNNDADAKMDLVISFPQTETRAADSNASAQDVAIETVTVFIFNADGTHALGSPANLVKADFEDKGDNRYALLEAKRIATTSGSKHIYVGINLPAALKGVADEYGLINEASASGLASATSVAMLSSCQTPALKAQIEETIPTENIITAVVERLVAKIAVTHGNATYTVANADPSHGSFTVKPDMFTVGNLAPTFYPVQRIESSKLVTPLMSASTAPVNPMLPLNASNITLAKDLTSTFYVPEHTTSIHYLRGEATYAVVRTELTFTKFATVVEGVLTLTDAGTHTGDLFVVIKGDNVYFCATEAIANEVGAKLGTLGAEIYTYEAATGGQYYTFYYVFINKDVTSDPLAVYRNQFVNYKVNGVKGLGVPGQPGQPGEPPVDPPKPKEPVFESNAYLEVIVDVKPWDYRAVGVVLED